MRVIEPGSFCEVDILDLESPITHTATTKWVVEDCDYGSGRTYISFYQCAVTDCSAAAPECTVEHCSPNRSV